VTASTTPGLTSGMNRYRELGAALIAVVIGSAVALLLAGLTWQTITASRPRPAGDVVTHVSGRDLEPAVIGLGVVALAGVVAVLATRGLAKRVVGGLIALAGIGIIWRAALGVTAVTPARARSLINDGLTGAGIDTSVSPHVSPHPVAPILVVVAGLLIAAGGGLVAIRGAAWTSMSGRYEAPTQAAQAARAAAPVSDLAVWTALDRGDDPTVGENPINRPNMDVEQSSPAGDEPIRTEP
jgi:uncharacterized membrane protein (TIGR02234 family)